MASKQLPSLQSPTFAAISHHMRWLDANVSRPTRRIFEKLGGTAIKQCLPEGYPRGTAEILLLNLTYATARHRFWIHAPVFVDLLTEFVTDDYALPRSSASTLAEAFCDLAAASPQTAALDLRDVIPGQDRRDREFLRFVFVATATASSEEDLILDMGLGTRILKRIKQAAEAAMLEANQTSADPSRDEYRRDNAEGDQKKTNRAIAIFVPEIDAQFATIMSDFAREIRRNNAALEIERMRFHLMQHASSAQIAATPREKLSGYFDELVALTAAGDKSEDDISKDFLPVALASDLIFNSNMGSKFGKKGRRLSPTSFGEQLATPTICRRWLQTNPVAESKKPEPYFDEILAMRPLTQNSILQALASRNPETVVTFLLYAVKGEGNSPRRGLSPAAIDAIVSVILPLLEGADGLALIEQLTDKARPIWLREAVCRCVNNLGLGQSVRQHLLKVAKSDPSARVRDIASEALIA